jgi:hypothetical protein
MTDDDDAKAIPSRLDQEGSVESRRDFTSKPPALNPTLIGREKEIALIAVGHGKPVIRYFVSYAREDRKLKDALLSTLKTLLAVAKSTPSTCGTMVKSRLDNAGMSAFKRPCRTE